MVFHQNHLDKLATALNFNHFSVKEYFRTKTIQDFMNDSEKFEIFKKGRFGKLSYSGCFLIDENSAHKMTLEDCFDYLLADCSCKPLVPVRGDAFWREQSLSFLSYAACFWPQHLRNTTHGENDATAILTKIQALHISL